MQLKLLEGLNLDKEQAQSGWMMYSVMVLNNYLVSAYPQDGATATVITVKMPVSSAHVCDDLV